MTQAVEFSQVLIGDSTNTLIDVTQYVQSVKLPRRSAQTDLTTFATGGGPVIQNFIRGEAQADVQITFLYDPALLSTLEQIWGARGGSTVLVKTGKNASPQQGDQVYSGTFTLFQLPFNVNTTQPVTVTADFKPTDGGAIVPAWSPL